MPAVLEEGVLYVSDEYAIAIHLCACGCGSKVRTPLAPAEWQLRVEKGQATLFPSVGSWQLPCQSHYWVRGGAIVWAARWTEKEIIAGRTGETRRREEYFARREGAADGMFVRLRRHLLSWWRGG